MMKATKSLPHNYTHYYTLDLTKNRTLLVVINLVGIGLFFFFGWLFLRITAALRPGVTFLGGEANLTGLLALLATYLGVLVIHELVHGAFFWLITRERPFFGFKGLYAYAAAPDWYLPRDPFLVVGLAPLVLITLAGVALIPVMPEAVLPFWVFGLTINAAGAIGDMLVVGWLLTLSRSILVRDEGDKFSVYRLAPNPAATDSNRERP